MTHRYTVGGIGFISDEHLDGLQTDGFVDLELRVRFTDDFTRTSGRSSDALLVAGPMDTTGVIFPGTLECWLPATSGSSTARAWHLRQMAPVFSAVLGRLVLHAGAAEIDGVVVGFIGESGAGKSTLVRYLGDRGYAIVADDLLPVRFAPGATCPVGDRIAPLGALVFLRRELGDQTCIDRLPGKEALQRLVAHGFGEHGDAIAWGFQFDAYHRLVESVPLFDLSIPDDLNALPLVCDALRSLLSNLGTGQ